MVMVKVCKWKVPCGYIGRRGYKVLAIETSCDDSCVALLDRPSREAPPVVIDHLKSTLNSVESGGIIPTKAFVHHQQNLAKLVNEMCLRYDLHKSPPDLICVTRGPGMPGSLNIGCDTAKGLSVAWNKPIIGVHHMLGHLLVPRLPYNGQEPSFPFLSLLISGGHTMLIRSTSLVNHDIICDTMDIAAGDALDKCARKLGFKGNMIAKEMDAFINKMMHNNEGVVIDKDHVDLQSINIPLQNKPGRKDICSFSFSPFNGMVDRTLEKNGLSADDMDINTKFVISKYIQDTIFNHIIDKIKLSIHLQPELSASETNQFVLSGGVSANIQLRSKLSLAFPNFKFYYPDLSLCTDNAVMIGWAGIELFENYQYTSGLDFNPIKKWPLNDILNY